MVIYEVNLAVDADIAEEYAGWLGPHIKEVLAIDGFLSAEWFEVESDAADKIHWSIQYRVKHRTALETYFIEHAERMRGAGLERFAGRFSANRRILNRSASLGQETPLY